jgi:hypothetical protein
MQKKIKVFSKTQQQQPRLIFSLLLETRKKNFEVIQLKNARILFL